MSLTKAIIKEDKQKQTNRYQGSLLREFFVKGKGAKAKELELIQVVIRVQKI